MKFIFDIQRIVDVYGTDGIDELWIEGSDNNRVYSGGGND